MESKEKQSVLGQIKEYQSDDKANPNEKKETNKEVER